MGSSPRVVIPAKEKRFARSRIDMRTTFLAAFALSTATAASAQVQVIATESFDYTVPGLLLNSSGGTGFSGAWDVTPGGNEVVMFDQSILPFPGADAVGAYIGQANGFGQAVRVVDSAPHGDVAELAGFGRDGGTVWITFRSKAYQVFGSHLGGMYLRDLNGVDRVFIGSPWATFAWGVDDLSPMGAGITTVPSDTRNDAVLVARIDAMAGDERVRLYVDPSTPYPVGPADVDVMVPDFRWNELVFTSGGAGSAYFWDGISIAKGDPSIGTSFCPANPNSTGLPGGMNILGSGTLAANDTVLQATGVPSGQFGIFVTSRFVSGGVPAGDGILCLTSSIGRYQEFSQIRQADANGEFTLSIDLTAMPTPSAFVSAMPGETWYFQAWHRDGTSTGPTSNFTAGSSFIVQ